MTDPEQKITPKESVKDDAKASAGGKKWVRWVAGGAVVLVVALGVLAWWVLKPKQLGPGFASGNGRIEAVEVDIAAKAPGRLLEILVNEGDFITAGQILARMDTAVLVARLREAEAQLQRALIGVDTARSLVVQREADQGAATAVVAQRGAELDSAQRHAARSEQLASGGNVPLQKLDDDRATFQGAKAGVSSSQAQVAAADAAIGSAKSQILGAQSDVEAARATIQSIQADIDDSTLRSPRSGRVQYRVAQPGEVLAAGGKVLNLVDLSDVYMTFFLPEAAVGRVALGTEIRLVLDAAPQWVIPARASFVADVAQFTPKAVETASERQKLMFRVRARIDPDLLQRNLQQVKTGLPGMAYVRLDPTQAWPDRLAVHVPN